MKKDRRPGGEAFICGGNICRFGATGICGLARSVESQATAGGKNQDGTAGGNIWPRERWEAYLERMDKSAGACADPAQYNDAKDRSQSMVNLE